MPEAAVRALADTIPQLAWMANPDGHVVIETTVNGEMSVGAVEETITVTGQAATVDVQSVTRQQVLNHQTIEALPSGRNYYSLGVLIPGVSSNASSAMCARWT